MFTRNITRDYFTIFVTKRVTFYLRGKVIDIILLVLVH